MMTEFGRWVVSEIKKFGNIIQYYDEMSGYINIPMNDIYYDNELRSAVTKLNKYGNTYDNYHMWVMNIWSPYAEAEDYLWISLEEVSV